MECDAMDDRLKGRKRFEILDSLLLNIENCRFFQ